VHILEVPADVGNHHVPRRKLNSRVARLEKPFCHDVTVSIAQRFFGGDGGTAEELADARIPAAAFLCFQQVPMVGRLPMLRR